MTAVVAATLDAPTDAPTAATLDAPTDAPTEDSEDNSVLGISSLRLSCPQAPRAREPRGEAPASGADTDAVRRELRS
jgi:hypothetical protein